MAPASRNRPRAARSRGRACIGRTKVLVPLARREAKQERHERARGSDDRHPPLLEGGLACVLGVELLLDELGVDLASWLRLRIRHPVAFALPERAQRWACRTMGGEESLLPGRRASSSDGSRSETPPRGAG